MGVVSGDTRNAKCNAGMGKTKASKLLELVKTFFSSCITGLNGSCKHGLLFREDALIFE
jgi:hypothetical protein